MVRQQRSGWPRAPAAVSGERRSRDWARVRPQVDDFEMRFADEGLGIRWPGVYQLTDSFKWTISYLDRILISCSYRESVGQGRQAPARIDHDERASQLPQLASR